MGIEARLDVIGNRAARRGRPRRTLVLRTKGASTLGDAVDVTIHNLSSTGLLLHTSASLECGDELNLELPEAPEARATVVWADETLFGCEFVEPVSQAVLSATELQSGPDRAKLSPAMREHQAIKFEPFGARMRRLRKSRGISLAALAARLGVSRPTVWAWESGKSIPRRAKIPLLMAELGMSDEEISPHGQSVRPDFPSRPVPLGTEPSKLAALVAGAKANIAELAGTTADKVRIIIEI
jgi:transcriptional regulator with XRE-family HTH domain